MPSLVNWLQPGIDARGGDKTAVVLRATVGPNDRSGVPTEEWVPTGDTATVQVQHIDGREVPTPAGEVLIANHRIFGALNPPFAASDRLEIAGTIYELLDVDPDMTGVGHHSESLARTAATLVHDA